MKCFLCGSELGSWQATWPICAFCSNGSLANQIRAFRDFGFDWLLPEGIEDRILTYLDLKMETSDEQ